jgi:hypothetical protein
MQPAQKTTGIFLPRASAQNAQPTGVEHVIVEIRGRHGFCIQHAPMQQMLRLFGLLVLPTQAAAALAGFLPHSLPPACAALVCVSVDRFAGPAIGSHSLEFFQDSAVAFICPERGAKRNPWAD